MRQMILTVMVAAFVAGCNRTNSGETAHVEKQLEHLGKEAQTAVVRAEPTVKAATTKAVQTVEEAAVSGRVKAALMLDRSIDTSHINVDTKGKTVILRGSVPQAAQSKHAVEVVQKEAMGYSIANELKVKKTT